MTLTRRQALALAATAPVAAVLPAAVTIVDLPAFSPTFTYADWIAAERAYRNAHWLEWSRETERSLVAMVRYRDRLLAERPPVQLSTLSTPQENRDRNQIDEACGTKSVQIDPTGDLCPDVSV